MPHPFEVYTYASGHPDVPLRFRFVAHCFDVDPRTRVLRMLPATQMGATPEAAAAKLNAFLEAEVAKHHKPAP